MPSSSVSLAHLGNGSKPSSLPSDSKSAFCNLRDAMETCIQHESYYTDAEGTKDRLLNLEIQSRELSEQLQQKSLVVEDLVLKFEKSGEEKAKLRNEANVQSAQLQGIQKQQHLLTQQIEKTEVSLAKAIQALENEKIRSGKLQEMLKSKEVELRESLTSSKSSREELRKWQSYKSTLLEVDLDRFREGISSIWRDTADMSEKYFRADIPRIFLERQSGWLDQAQAIYGEQPLPPIPASNSDVAKDVRMAIALAVFSSLVSMHLLQTTYIEGGKLELHDILLDKAYSNDEAESLCRALLLSISDFNNHDPCINSATDAIYNGFSIFANKLLGPTEYKNCMTDIQLLLSRIMDLWQDVQRSTVKVDASRHLGETSEWSRFSSGTMVKATQTAASRDTMPNDVVLVLFPGFIKTCTGRREMLFPRMVLTRSQIISAEAEAQAEADQAIPRPQKGQSRGRRNSILGKSLFLGVA
ncbi:MAG: Uncharacterized protein AUREO_049220 [Aureobasidium pullulans]|uniref:Uncharacterized protein n=2 Tax=Aureobasidium pullulans TaxID=5580 RepID=A0A074YEX5_AURPU|nr:uncharacterized protein M438DRAFT_354481 [Aureobasidium pullulans EXF-150]KEQ85406.1 hypothetical protein M438DRAFT_354481 [Aureobasidium pullulans EXF-150]OBW65013.1 MAG: Uncharacterized protein AUREO_049220 [Aureobasidium pullulans]THV71892.1 hypothetical protein D6D29_09528 [Aureobasidium pullulans]THZ16547.1 hypothetical protein D6C91_06314 [Aureobasidium pullulans]